MASAKTRNYLFLVLLGVVSIIFFFVLRPFAYPIFWAAVLASLFHPVFRRINHSVKHNGVSALLTLLIVILITLVPMALIGMLFVKELINVYLSINNNQGQVSDLLQSINHFLHSSSYLARFNINDQIISQRLDDLSRSLLTFLIDSIKYVTQNSLEFIALFTLMLYTLFYFLRDGEKLLKKLMYLIPVGRDYEKMFYERFTTTVSATLKGTVLVGAIQGVMGGIIFWLTGVPSPLIWGLAMGILGAIPVTGTFLVWLPAGIIMIIAGHTAQGFIILAAGVSIISIIDNMLRPYLVGIDLQMHPVIILFSMLGGVVVFGVTGFILGPIVATLFQSLWEIYEHYYKKELEKN